MNMKVTSARYLTSVVDKSKILRDDQTEIAFVGRSKGSGRLMVKCSSCGAIYFMR